MTFEIPKIAFSEYQNDTNNVNIQKLHPCVEEGIESKFKKT
jgi:hypothetical protein